MIKVSIVVPVYNVSEYIERCWDSIKSQSYKNLEVLFIDDCGADDSIAKLEICLSKADDIDVRIIHHAKNRGLSAARNTGLAAATGDYVYFLDSDDDITSDCIESLIAPLSENECDFVIGDYSKVGETVECPPLVLKTGDYLGNNNILRLYAEGKWYMMAWNKLCRKEFLIKNDLLFEEGLIHEDVLWSFKLACSAESMYVVDKPTYRYTIRANSIMTAAKIEKDAYEYVRVFRLMSEYVGSSKDLMIDKYVYSILEGRKSTLLFSLLSKGRKDIYREIYPLISSYQYINVFKAFKSRVIGVKYLIRDLHYLLPSRLGRMYKTLFYMVVYKLFGIKLDGTLW